MTLNLRNGQLVNSEQFSRVSEGDTSKAVHGTPGYEKFLERTVISQQGTWCLRAMSIHFNSYPFSPPTTDQETSCLVDLRLDDAGTL